MNSLRSIQFGSGCFQFANDFILKGIFRIMIIIIDSIDINNIIF